VKVGIGSKQTWKGFQTFLSYGREKVSSVWHSKEGNEGRRKLE